MPDLESEELSEQRNQKWQCLKILTQCQMFSGLPISIAKLKTGNNSEKLKRQQLYSLYHSKKLTKTIYNKLIIYNKYAYNDNKFKISAPAWNDKLDLHDGSYSLSDIQHYFEYIIKDMKL